MSGRQKRPLTAEEEREQLRQLTRELHEAAQGARDAARELRAERAALGADVDELIGELVHLQLDKLEQLISENREVVARAITDYRDQLQDVYAQLIGLDDPEKLTAYMSQQFMDALLTEEFLEVIAGHVARFTFGDVQPRAHAARGGTVRVATREQLAAFVAAGGDPGMIIDGR